VTGVLVLDASVGSSVCVHMTAFFHLSACQWRILVKEQKPGPFCIPCIYEATFLFNRCVLVNTVFVAFVKYLKCCKKYFWKILSLDFVGCS
jgi:hypothetical protein